MEPVSEELTKEQAVEAMQQGKKATHRYFMSGEYMTIRDGRFYFEDGNSISTVAFWHHRTHPAWNTGWTLWKEQ